MNKTRKILHIDDDPLMTRLTSERLGSYGYEVVTFNDPVTAMHELVRHQYRVVLLDIDMPGVSGLDLLKEIKSYDGGIQVIMLTGVVSMSTVLQSLRWGAEACIFKPLTNYAPLIESLEDAFRKIDRWWAALEDLSHRKKDDIAASLPT